MTMPYGLVPSKRSVSSVMADTGSRDDVERQSNDLPDQERCYGAGDAIHGVKSPSVVEKRRLFHVRYDRFKPIPRRPGRG